MSQRRAAPSLSCSQKGCFHSQIASALLFVECCWAAFSNISYYKSSSGSKGMSPPFHGRLLMWKHLQKFLVSLTANKRRQSESDLKYLVKERSIKCAAVEVLLLGFCLLISKNTAVSVLVNAVFFSNYCSINASSLCFIPTVEKSGPFVHDSYSMTGLECAWNVFVSKRSFQIQGNVWMWQVVSLIGSWPITPMPTYCIQ